MPLITVPYRIEAYARTDVGLVRENNEDCYAELSPIRTYLLADGMGGHAAGEVAAQNTIEILSELITEAFESGKKRNLKDTKRKLEQLIKQTNVVIYQRAQAEKELRGMGTTLCCALFHNEGLVYAHVGDSRIYRLHNGVLSQLTKDHSLVFELMELGELSAKQAKGCDYKNIITRAIGAAFLVNPDLDSCDIALGDQILMCSDGLSDLVSHEEIEKVLLGSSSINISVDRLIEMAKEKGGHDNITALLTKVTSSGK